MSSDRAVDLALVLGGGAGTRLWPWTGPDRPKPLLPLGGGGRTLLSATLDRLEPVIPADRIWLVAGVEIGERLIACDSRLDAGALCAEPSARDTAPAIALAMHRAREWKSDAVVAVLPADQRIQDVAAFQKALGTAASVARSGALVTLGVKPTHASTRFGYVECEPSDTAFSATRVRRFVEKPDASVAQRFMESGRHLWNAGIFVWRASEFWQALARHAPKVADAVERYADSQRSDDWERTPRISIDYALMEKADNVVAVPLDAGWDDVGSWEAVSRLVDQGDAGDARSVPFTGDAAPGTMVIRVGEATGHESVVLSERPLLVVSGPEGLLVTPLSESARAKEFLVRPDDVD